jgi:thiamine kinase-like enzyme
LSESSSVTASRTEAAAARAAALPIWRGKVDPQPLTGGITNANFVVEDGGRKYVVRIGGDIEVHGIVRRSEAAASRAAHQAGVSPEVVYGEPDALVFAYVEGKTFAPQDVADPANLDRLVHLLRACHREIPKHLRGPGILFWVFHVLRDYAHTLSAAGVERSRLEGLLARAGELEAAVGPVELAFGHNDLLAANIIDDGKRLWLVDWDYAGFNSPLFDIGGLASNYFDRPASDDLRRRFAAMTAASLLRETMWSMVSEIHSDLDFDYRAYTAENAARWEAAFAQFKAMDT